VNFIDIFYLLILVLAVWQGYQKGLVVGLFSLVAIIIGLAAAMKLSVVVAGYIGNAVNVSDEWLPIISFLGIFILVLILVRLGARAIEKGLQFAMLGWLNRIGGILLYAAIYTIIFSILLFYAEQVGFLKQEKLEHTLTYSFVQPWGPKVINSIGTIIPWFRDMFIDLQEFFGRVGDNISRYDGYHLGIIASNRLF
jgi:membrane protein required for colicin V production